MAVSNVGIDAGAPIAGARIMVVEDSVVIALDVGVRLEDAGCVVLGPCSSCADALALLAEERPDAALLDIELSDGPAAPVAEALARAGVPFAVMTGFEAEDLGGELGIAPLLAKPFASADVERVVAQLLKGGAAV